MQIEMMHRNTNQTNCDICSLEDVTRAEKNGMPLAIAVTSLAQLALRARKKRKIFHNKNRSKRYDSPLSKCHRNIKLSGNKTDSPASFKSAQNAN